MNKKWFDLRSALSIRDEFEDLRGSRGQAGDPHHLNEHWDVDDDAEENKID